MCRVTWRKNNTKKSIQWHTRHEKQKQKKSSIHSISEDAIFTYVLYSVFFAFVSFRDGYIRHFFIFCQCGHMTGGKYVTAVSCLEHDGVDHGTDGLV